MCAMTACSNGSRSDSVREGTIESDGSMAVNENTKIPWNQFSTVNDLSYPMWYLSVNEHVIDYSDWNVYEFNQEEVWAVLFQSNSEDESSRKYYLFTYDQLGDNPLTYAMIAEASSVTQIEADLEGESIFELAFYKIWSSDETFDLDYFNDGTILIRCNDSGRIDRIKFSEWYGFDIVYNNLTQIDSVHQETWDTLNSFATGEFASGYSMTYLYNEDGTLGSVTGVNTYDYDNLEHTDFEFEYDEDNKRLKTIDSYGYSCDYVTYSRDDQLTRVKYVYDKSEGIDTYYVIDYLDDGTFDVHR